MPDSADDTQCSCEPQPEQTDRKITSSKEFYERYKQWVDMQNEEFEKNGVFGQEFRVW